MNTGGWVMMIVSVGTVTGLLAWCVWRVRRESSPRKVHGPIDIETRDRE
jgi:heme/copper-type cytochrome/quinol oxidase subunit 2